MCRPLSSSSHSSTMSFPLPSRGPLHRRSQSEGQFRIPDDFDLEPGPFDGPSIPFEDLGSEDDLLSAYMDFDKSGSRVENESSAPNPLPGTLDSNGNAGPVERSGDGGNPARPRHRHSNSADESTAYEAIEAKKAMAPDKLAELWTVDPKRAKRFGSRPQRYRFS